MLCASYLFEKQLQIRCYHNSPSGASHDSLRQEHLDRHGKIWNLDSGAEQSDDYNISGVA